MTAPGDPSDPSEMEEETPKPATPPPVFSPRGPERAKWRLTGWWRRGSRSTSLRRTRERVDHWGFQVGRIVAICLIIGGLAFGGYVFIKSSSLDFPPRLFPTQNSESPSSGKQESSPSADPAPKETKPNGEKKEDKREKKEKKKPAGKRDK